MPLLSIVRTAVDTKHDAQLVEHHINGVVGFINNDTIFFRNTEHEKLRERQDQNLDPLVAYINKKFGLDMRAVEGIGCRFCC